MAQRVGGPLSNGVTVAAALPHATRVFFALRLFAFQTLFPPRPARASPAFAFCVRGRRRPRPRGRGFGQSTRRREKVANAEDAEDAEDVGNAEDVIRGGAEWT